MWKNTKYEPKLLRVDPGAFANKHLTVKNGKLSPDIKTQFNAHAPVLICLYDPLIKLHILSACQDPPCPQSSHTFHPFLVKCGNLEADWDTCVTAHWWGFGRSLRKPLWKKWSRNQDTQGSWQKKGVGVFEKGTDSQVTQLVVQKLLQTWFIFSSIYSNITNISTSIYWCLCLLNTYVKIFHNLWDFFHWPNNTFILWLTCPFRYTNWESTRKHYTT